MYKIYQPYPTIYFPICLFHQATATATKFNTKRSKSIRIKPTAKEVKSKKEKESDESDNDENYSEREKNELYLEDHT